ADPESLQVSLIDVSTDGFRGTDSTSGSAFFNMDRLVAASSSSNSLTGLDVPASWAVFRTVDFDQAGTYGSGSPTLAFANFHQLTGGDLQDTFDIRGTFKGSLFGGDGKNLFRFADDLSSVTGTIDGGRGLSTIDYSRGFSQSVPLTGLGAQSGFDGT